MEILDPVTRALNGMIRLGAKKLQRRQAATVHEAVQPLVIKNTEDDCYICGFSAAEVMPADVTAKKYYLAGYQMDQRVTGVLDPTTVSAMWLSCKEGEGILLVSADIIGLTGYDVDSIRSSMADFCQKSGCKNISVSCSHSHASIDTVGYWGKLPLTGKDTSYQQQLFAAIKRVCIEAYENRRPGLLYHGDVHVPECIQDGREPYVCNDKLTRLRFVPADGSAETWFMNYSAHPNTMGKPNAKVSADYPYFLRKTINAQKHVHVLFSVGAIGAVSIAPLAEDRLARTRIAGEKLGQAALAIANDVLLAPELVLVRQPYSTPIDNALLSLMSTIGAVTSKKAPCDKGSVGLALETEMTYLRLGGKQILMLPGEAFPEVVYGGYADAEHSSTGLPPTINALPLCEIAGDENLIIFGVTNDMTGYIVPKNDYVLHKTQAYVSSAKDRFGHNHYHETNSLGYLTTDTVAGVFADIMRRVNSLA